MQGEKYIITGTENNQVPFYKLIKEKKLYLIKFLILKQIVIYETKTEEVINKIST